MTELIVAVSFAMLASALCSLFEAVLYSVPMSHIEGLSEDKARSGAILRELRQNVERPIAAILSLNTIANTAGAAVAGAAFDALYGHRNLAYFTAALTLAILVFSEVVPKTVGVIHCRRLSEIIARPLRFLVVLFTPLVWLCGLVSKLVSKGHSSEAVSGKEVIAMARMGQKSGRIDQDQVKVIENILRLEQKVARDIMTPRSVIVAHGVNTSVAEAREDPGVLEHSRIPVYDQSAEDMVGYVHRRDVLTAIADDKDDMKLEVITNPVRFVLDNMPIAQILKHALKEREHIFIVIDDHGTVVGLITLEDILEEILGEEIIDEFDRVVDMRELARRRKEELIRGQEGESAP